MVNLQMALEEKGVLLTDPGAAEIYRQEVIKGGVEATEMVLSMISIATPVRQGGGGGFLAKAWQRQYLAMDVPFESLITNPVPYGETVEKGSRPHVILPRNKKALAFVPGAAGAMLSFTEKQGHGETIIIKAVHHPGTKPTNFVAKTLRQIEAGPWPKLWGRVVDRIVEKLS